MKWFRGFIKTLTGIKVSSDDKCAVVDGETLKRFAEVSASYPSGVKVYG